MMDLMMMWTGWLEGELYLLGADPAAIEICRELRQGLLDLEATCPGVRGATWADPPGVQ